MLLTVVMLGTLVGFSLGLTGGGGAIFAVPLLVYLMHVPAKEAIAISVFTVGSTAFVGFLQRWKNGLVEIPTGLLFAIAGMVGAPVGFKAAASIPDPLLLALFAILMLVVAVRMWMKSKAVAAEIPIVQIEESTSTCQRDNQGNLKLNSRCAVLLVMVGVATGFLTGMFGVGGGFIIVPALIAFSNMTIKRAIGTSLFVITLVSVSGIVTHLMAGQNISAPIAINFTLGSLLGLAAGTWLAQRLAGPMLQRVFSLAIIVVAIFVLTRTAMQSATNAPSETFQGVEHVQTDLD